MKINRYLTLTIIWMLVIFFFSSQNAEMSSMNNSFVLEILAGLGIDVSVHMPLDTANFIIRKVAHFTEYLILGMLIYKTLKNYMVSNPEIIALASGFLYACSDEAHQYFVPGRGPAFTDVLIDTSGVLAGVLILWIVCFKRKKYKKGFWNGYNI